MNVLGGVLLPAEKLEDGTMAVANCKERTRPRIVWDSFSTTTKALSDSAAVVIVSAKYVLSCGKDSRGVVRGRYSTGLSLSHLWKDRARPRKGPQGPPKMFPKMSEFIDGQGGGRVSGNVNKPLRRSSASGFRHECIYLKDMMKARLLLYLLFICRLPGFHRSPYLNYYGTQNGVPDQQLLRLYELREDSGVGQRPSAPQGAACHPQWFRISDADFVCNACCFLHWLTHKHEPTYA